MSDEIHFSILNNEVVVKKSGIVLLTVLKAVNPYHYGFVGQISRMGFKPIRKLRTRTPLVIDGFKSTNLLHN